MKIREILARAPVVPVIVIERVEEAVPLARALVAGGLTVLEVTLRTPVAFDAIAAMREAVPDAIVGAGTLTRPEDFVRAEQAGAQFAVTPGFTLELAAAATDVAFPLLPGIATASEILAARHSGYDTLKFFPAQQAGGVPMLQAFFGPFADVRFCPTGGVTRENAPAYLQLPNVLAVGGSWVAPKSLVSHGNWSAIEELAREAAALPRPGLSS